MKKTKQTGIQLDLFAEVDFEDSSERKDSPRDSSKATPKGIKKDSQEIPLHKGSQEVAAPAKATHTDDRSSEVDTIYRQIVSEGKHNLTALFERLAQSDFRRGFHLSRKDREYIDSKGLDTIRLHAIDFVSKRLAPAFIPNDGKQTPMRGHPVFVAQHATGCCCRGCFYKWHHIAQGRALTLEEQAYAVNVLMSWIEREYRK